MFEKKQKFSSTFVTLPLLLGLPQILLKNVHKQMATLKDLKVRCQDVLGLFCFLENSANEITSKQEETKVSLRPGVNQKCKEFLLK